MKHLKWVIRNISVIKLYKWIDSIKITFNFYFPRTSRHNYRGVDVFSDIFELLLLLYFTFMTRVRCLKFHFAIIQKSDLYATLHQRLWICQRRPADFVSVIKRFMYLSYWRKLINTRSSRFETWLVRADKRVVFFQILFVSLFMS